MRFGAPWPWVASLLIAPLLITSMFQPAEGSLFTAPPGPTSSDNRQPPNDRLGIDHVSYGGQIAAPQRYQAALEAGAGWNRWVAYWHDIERVQGFFDYDRYDATVNADRSNGLNLNVVLMGTPGFYATTTPSQAQAAGKDITTAASAPANLDQPVFADGTDVPSAGKAINPKNYWARFVNSTVNRYKGQVRYWEMWNEPDNRTFWWTGDNQEVKHYLRLLKVAYLAAKAADPGAQVLMGGLMNWEWANRTGSDFGWLRALFDEMAKDPDRDRNGQYFDILPLHWYARAADLYDKTLAVRQILDKYHAPNKPIWINETNLAVCGDPRTAGKPDCTPGVAKGVLDEQAAFLLQASANAIAAGVDKVFAFQLYDDSTGAFDYYGLLRNDNSRRPAFTAYQVAASYFRDIKSAVKVSVTPVEMVTMVTNGGGVVGVVWNNSPASVTVAIPARASRAMLIEQNGKARSIDAEDGAYYLTLPGATFNLNPASPKADYPVGGMTYVISETPDAPAPPAATPAAAIQAVTGQPTALASERSSAGQPVTTTMPIATITPSATPTPTATMASATPTAIPSTPTPTPTPSPIPNSYQIAPIDSDAADTLVPSAMPSPSAESTPDTRLTVPSSLSTARISDIRHDGFSVSWIGSAPAPGELQCRDASEQAGFQFRGTDRRGLVHLIALGGLRSDTTYLCQVQAGAEVDNNGGSLFSIRTLARVTDEQTTRLRGTALDENGQPRAALIYATVFDRNGLPKVTGGLSAANGQWALDVPLTSTSDSGLFAGSTPRVTIAAVSAAGLSTERTLNDAETEAIQLRLGFTWAHYRASSIALQQRWNQLSLPFVPLNNLTAEAMAREVAAQGGKIGALYVWDNEQWHGGQTDGNQIPVIYGRQYAIWAEVAGVWTVRGVGDQVAAHADTLQREASR